RFGVSHEPTTDPHHGAGFGGLWSALSAVRLLDQARARRAAGRRSARDVYRAACDTQSGPIRYEDTGSIP
ncbi:hypothetical protein EPU36_27030, partial [Escherichia coli]